MSTEAAVGSRVLELRVQNFKRILDVHLVPSGPVTKVIGKNEAGKSSVLDSICAVLGGADWCPTIPVHKGKKTGEVKLVLSDMTAVRKWTAGKDKNGELFLYASDGTPIKRPQEVLNALISRIAFDPLSFERSKPADRLAVLAKIAGVDLAGFQRRRDRLAVDQADVNKDIKRVEVHLDGMPAANDEIPTEEVSVAGILTKIEAAEAANREAANAQQVAEMAEVNADLSKAAAAAAVMVPADLEAELADKLKAIGEEYAAKIEAARESATRLDKAAEEAIQRRDAATEAAKNAKMIDVAPLKDQIRRADTTNNLVRQQAERRKKAAEGNALLERRAKIKADMEAIDDEKHAAVAAAKLPIAGLALGTDDVELNKIPFEQCSSAQKLELSATVGLETNKLKLMLIHDGSLLDSDRMKLLEAIAERYQAQMIIERVSDGEGDGEIGVRITEGYTAAELEAAQATKAELELPT